MRVRLATREEQGGRLAGGQRRLQQLDRLLQAASGPRDLGGQHLGAELGVGLQLEAVQRPHGQVRGLLGLVEKPGVEPGEPQQHHGERADDGMAALVGGGLGVVQVSRPALGIAGAPCGQAPGHEGERDTPGVPGGFEQLRRPLGLGLGLGDVPEFGGGDRVDRQAHGQAPHLTQRPGHLDQVAGEPAGPAELAGQQPDQRLGARAPAQPAGVVEPSEDLGGVSEVLLGTWVVPPGGRAPGKVLEGPADPSGIADPTGEGQRVGEPLLGVAHPAGGIFQQAELAQGGGDHPVAAGALGLLERGDERGRGLVVPALLVPQIAEDAVRRRPQLGGGDPQCGPQDAFGLVQPAQRRQGLGVQHDRAQIVEFAHDPPAEPAGTGDQIAGAAMVVAGERRAGDPDQGVEPGLPRRPGGIGGRERHRCREVVGPLGMVADEGRDLRLGAAEKLHPPLGRRGMPAGPLHLGQAGVGDVPGHRVHERPHRLPGMRGPQELAFGECRQRPVHLLPPAVLQRGQRVRGEPAAEHRRRAQDGLRDRVEIVDTGGQHRLHTGRQRGLGQGSLKYPAALLGAGRVAQYLRGQVRARGGAVRRDSGHRLRSRRAGAGICASSGGCCAGRVAAVQVTAVQDAPVHQQVQQFGEEERVAVDPREQGGPGGLVQFGAAEIVAQQAGRGGLRQRGERERLGVGQPGQRRDLAVKHDQKYRPAQPAGETPQPLPQRGRRPFQVVQDDDQRPVVGQAAKQHGHVVDDRVDGPDGGIVGRVLPPGRVSRRDVRSHRRAALRRHAQQGEQLVGHPAGDAGACRRMLQPADRAPYPFGDPVRTVTLPDPAGGPHDVHERGEIPAVTVADRAAPQHPRVLLRARPAGQFHRYPGLADAGLTSDDDRPWLAVRDDVPEGGLEHREVLVAPGERRVVAVPGPGDVGRSQADQLVGGDRLTLALELQRGQPAPGRDRGRGDHGVVARVHGAHRGGVRQPGGGVHRVADHRVGQRRLDAGQHLPGVDPDAQAEVASAAGFVGDEAADGLLHGGGGAHGSFRVVLVRGRRAEHGHDAVTGEVVDPAADLGDVTGQGGEHPVGDLADPFGIQVLRPCGEVREVAEQDGDDPALGALVGAHAVFGLQRQPAVETEPAAGNGGSAAARTAQRSTEG